MSIADKFNVLVDVKNDMKSAIESKGVTITGGLSSYADAIDSIVLQEDAPEFTFEKLGDDYDILEAMTLSINSIIKRDISYTQTRLSSKNPAGSMWENYTGWLECLSEPLYYEKGLTFCPKFDAEGITDMKCFMANNTNLMYVPKIDTHNATTMYKAFYGCTSLYAVADLDVRSATDMSYVFGHCSSLSYAPVLNTEGVTRMSGMFMSCDILETIPQYDTSGVVAVDYMLSTCSNLKIIPEMNFSSVKEAAFLCGSCEELTDIGGFVDFGKAGIEIGYPYHQWMFSGCHKITRDSVLNIFNKLYGDYSWNIKNKHQLGFEQSVIDRLSDEDIAIATNKGWEIVVI